LLQEANPFYWLARGDRAGSFALKGVLVLLFLLWAGCLAIGAAVPSRHDDLLPFSMFILFAMHLVAKVMMATESGRRFNLDRQSGALEILLVTPLRVRAIVAGQRAALRAQFLRWICALCLANLLTMVAILLLNRRSLHMQDEELACFVAAFLGGGVLLWLDSAALSWLGMWKGLKAKKHPRAVLGTLAQVVVLPWVCLFVIGFLAVLLNSIGVLFSPFGENTLGVYLMLWFLLGALIDICSIAYARTRLASDFRAIVARRYDG
jgi:hypothetical protein